MNFNRIHARRVILRKVPKKRTFTLKPLKWRFFDRNVILDSFWKKKALFLMRNWSLDPSKWTQVSVSAEPLWTLKSAISWPVASLWRRPSKPATDLCQTRILGSPYLRLEIPYRRSAIHMPHLAAILASFNMLALFLNMLALVFNMLALVFNMLALVFNMLALIIGSTMSHM